MVSAMAISFMSTLIVPLPDEDLAFLETYSAAQGTSAGELLAVQARRLREFLQSEIHGDIVDAVGIIDPGVSAEPAFLSHLEEKHS